MTRKELEKKVKRAFDQAYSRRLVFRVRVSKGRLRDAVFHGMTEQHFLMIGGFDSKERKLAKRYGIIREETIQHYQTHRSVIVHLKSPTVTTGFKGFLSRPRAFFGLFVEDHPKLTRIAKILLPPLIAGLLGWGISKLGILPGHSS